MTSLILLRIRAIQVLQPRVEGAVASRTFAAEGILPLREHPILRWDLFNKNNQAAGGLQRPSFTGK